MLQPCEQSTTSDILGQDLQLYQINSRTLENATRPLGLYKAVYANPLQKHIINSKFFTITLQRIS